MGNQFADDTITYVQGHTTTEIQTLMQTEIIYVKEWLFQNNLSLNTSDVGVCTWVPANDCFTVMSYVWNKIISCLKISPKVPI